MTRHRLDARALVVGEDERFRVSQAAFCAWPGYLILRLKGPERSLAQLDPDTAVAFGLLLARCASALERVTEAERVYLLSFAEVDRQLHVHLLPRTGRLREAWAEACGVPRGDDVDGPALFQWCRETYRGEEDLPVETPRLEDVLAALRRELAGDAEAPGADGGLSRPGEVDD